MDKLESILAKKIERKKIIKSNNSSNEKLKQILEHSSYNSKLDQAKELITRGKNYFERNKEEECKEAYHKAKEILELIYKKNYQNKDLYIAYGEVLTFLAFLDDALAVYNKGTSLFPHNNTLAERKSHIENILNSEVDLNAR